MPIRKRGSPLRRDRAKQRGTGKHLFPLKISAMFHCFTKKDGRAAPLRSEENSPAHSILFDRSPLCPNAPGGSFVKHPSH